jgi:hypothetical protein
MSLFNIELGIALPENKEAHLELVMDWSKCKASIQEAGTTKYSPAVSTFPYPMAMDESSIRMHYATFIEPSLVELMRAYDPDHSMSFNFFEEKEMNRIQIDMYVHAIKTFLGQLPRWHELNS